MKETFNFTEVTIKDNSYSDILIKGERHPALVNINDDKNRCVVLLPEIPMAIILNKSEYEECYQAGISRECTISEAIEELKHKSIVTWVAENTKDYDIFMVYPTENKHVSNNVEGHGGHEFLDKDKGYLAVQHRDHKDDLVIQVRKGAIFYLLDDGSYGKQPLEYNAMTYATMKEIKYIINNDYKHWGTVNV